MAAPAPARQYRPSATLRMPLQTGNGFAMSLFMWAAFWMLALAVLVTGLGLLAFGHWIVGPVLALAGAFFVAAFWSFPREVWVSRPCDLELTPEGFRVLGGYRAGAGSTWEELDAAASGIRDCEQPAVEELVAVTRSGALVPLAEGEEHDAFVAVLDAFRACEGLEPVPPRFKDGHGEAVQLRASKARSRTPVEKRVAEERPERVVVQILRCERCGAAACPADAVHSTCRYCAHPVPMSESLRKRVREMSAEVKLKKQSRRTLERLLAQPSAPITLALMGVLAALMLASWLFGAGAVVRAVSRGTLDFRLLVAAIAAPVLLALVLSILASVVASRRVAVRAVAVDFAAVAPAEAGKPYGCRVCGAPLPELGEPVVRCAYCASSNVLSCARPRAPAGVKDQRRKLEEALEHQRVELIVRLIFLVIVGGPALYGAVLAVRTLLRA